MAQIIGGEKRQKLGVFLTFATHARLQAEAEKRGLSMTKVVESILEDYLARIPKRAA